MRRHLTAFYKVAKKRDNAPLKSEIHDREGELHEQWNSWPWRFRYLILISTIFLRFHIFVFSLALVFDWEDISNTQDSHVTILSNTLNGVRPRLRIVFSTLFSVFGNVLKHGVSCLICYLYSHLKYLWFSYHERKFI